MSEKLSTYTENISENIIHPLAEKIAPGICEENFSLLPGTNLYTQTKNSVSMINEPIALAERILSIIPMVKGKYLPMVSAIRFPKTIIIRENKIATKNTKV